MSQEYDVKDVNIYITNVMRLSPLDRVDLWRKLQDEVDDNAANDASEILVMVHRFHQQQRAVQANILYRFGPIIEKIVREQAQKVAKQARREGAM